MNALNIAFIVYVPVLICGFAAVITCLLVGRRPWSKPLCAIGLAITGLLLLLLTGLFLQGAVSTGGYHGEAGMAGSILVVAIIPVVAEFITLFTLAWRWRLSRKDAEVSQQWGRSDDISGCTDRGRNQ